MAEDVLPAGVSPAGQMEEILEAADMVVKKHAAALVRRGDEEFDKEDYILACGFYKRALTFLEPGLTSRYPTE